MGGGVIGRLSRLLSGKSGELAELLILYFYSLSTASPNPKDVVKMASASDQTLGDLAMIFRRVITSVERWGYQLNKSIRYMLGKIDDEDIRDFLKRLSDSATLSLDIGNFVKVELERMMAALVDEFERRLERVRKLVDAYSAILTSAAFLSVSMLLVASIYGADVNRLLSATSIGISTLLVLMSILFARALPPDQILNDGQHLGNLRTLKNLATIMIPASTMSTLTLMLALSGSANEVEAMALPLLSSGIPLIIIGRLGLRWVKKAEEIDRSLPSLMKGLGDAVAVSGSLRAACKLILMNDYGSVNQHLRKLLKRLEMGFSQRLALRAFGRELASRLAYTMSSLMADALHYGARGSVVGKAIHDYALRRIENRKKRVQVAGMLWGIALPLQAIFAAISALISVLMKIMSSFAGLMSSWLPLITPISEQSMNIFFLSITLGSAYASAFSYYRVRGGSVFTFTYALGFLLAVSGAVYALSSLVSQSILGMAENLTREINSLLGEL